MKGNKKNKSDDLEVAYELESKVFVPELTGAETKTEEAIKEQPEKKERKDREKENLIRDNEALKIENEKLRETLARTVQRQRVSEVPGTGTPVSCIEETGGDPIAITKAKRGRE